MNSKYNSNSVSINQDNIPQELKDRQRWCCWKYENGTKIPHQPLLSKADIAANPIGAKASSSDRGTWCSYQACLEALEHSPMAYDGIGFFLGGEITGVDLDRCLYDGKLTPIASSIIDKLDSYTEVSPSGTGVKVFLYGKKPLGPCNTTEEIDFQKLEIYSEARFFTVTGRSLGKRTSLQPRQPELEAVFSSFLSNFEKSKKETGAGEPKDLPLDDKLIQAKAYLDKCPPTQAGRGADAYCYAVAMTLMHGYNLDSQDVEDLLYDWGQAGITEDGSPYPWSHQEIAHKVRDVEQAEYDGVRGDKLSQPVIDPVDSVIQAVDIPEKAKDKPKLITWKALKQYVKDNPLEWLVKGILPTPAIVLLSGKSYSAKTTVTDHLIAAMAKGEDFLGCSTKRRRILLWDYDRNEYYRVPRLSNLADDETLQEWVSTVQWDDYPTPLTAQAIRPYLDEPTLVVIDPFRTAMLSASDSGGENDSVAITRVLGPLKPLVKDTHSTILLLHHNNRAHDEYAGSMAIAGVTDALWSISRDDGTNICSMRVKTRITETKFNFCLGECGLTLLDDTEELQQFVTAIGQVPLTRKQILSLPYVQAKGWSDSSVDRRLKEAVAGGLLGHEGKQSNKSSYAKITLSPPRE